ncbi:hypothetical protein BYT27DRAFT_7232117 [Phlegmacium glaucopus]|nr:hypothetical protein BYT27DRAFT_7232117 [Phlegmacium glaucopus]
MTSETHYLRSILPSLPIEIASKLRDWCTSPVNESIFENLIRFLSGAEHSPDASKDIYEQWSEKQAATRNVLSNLTSSYLDKKRARDINEDQMDDANSQQSKRPRVGLGQPEQLTEIDSSGDPLMTLHALSATSPIRKKVDITIHKNVIKFTNPTSHAVEGTISVSSMKRAFIVPTRGKAKPHWTVIVLSSDIPDRGKPIPGRPSPDNQQLIFGTDAVCASNFSITTYPDAMSHNSKLAKGAPTLPSLREFLSHLAIPIIEPTVDVFKSACPGIGSNAGVGGIPGAEAYRAAKSGNLWFSKDGILWGESKPCEFWPVGDLINKMEGLRIVGSGRTCSVILARKSSPEYIHYDKEDVVEETEFGMVDAKEKEGINEWVRRHRHLFGNQRKRTIPEEQQSPKVQPTGPLTIHALTEGSDDDDDDFSASVSDLDGSEGSSEETSSEDGDNENEGGSRGERGSDGNADTTEDLEDEDRELDPAEHPLLRPGAMPRMSRAALEMAVDIVENAFVGTGVEEEDEEDELDD